MGIEVPEGNEASPEQPQERGEKEVSASTPIKKWLAVFGLMSLVLAAVLVGVLPDWKNEDEKKTLTSSTESGASSSTEALFLETRGGAFDVRLPLFSEKITEGYASEDDLRKDLTELSKFILNDSIKNNKQMGMTYAYDDGRGDGDTVEDSDGSWAEVPPAMAAPGSEAMPEASFAGDMAQTTQESNKVAGVTDFETNNQEETVDRADFVKSDGKFVYAAYSDHLIVWTIDGQGIVKKIKMPELNVTDDHYWGGIPEPFPMDGADMVDGGGEDGVTDAMPAMSARSSMPWRPWNPSPRIESLLIDGNRLTAVISGYGYEHAQALGSKAPYLPDYLATRIQVYDINDGDLQLLMETDVNGGFRNAYSADDNVYVVTQSGINTWDHLMGPLDRWHPDYAGLDDSEYEAKALKRIDEGLIDDFVDGLLAELQVNGEIDLAGLSVFVDSISTAYDDESMYYNSIPTSISQVISFSMNVESSNAVGVLKPHIAATFHPGSWGHVYAMGSMIVIADQGWGWIARDGWAAEKTFLVGFSLDGPSSSHSIIGSVDGSLLNPFSLDFVERDGVGYLRVASTQRFWQPWVGPMEGEVVMMEGDGMMMEGGMNEDGMVAEDSKPSPEEPESSTLNEISVLRVPSNSRGTMENVGSVTLGEPNEVFTSVRFFDRFAYAVTFEQIDPFYVVDLSNEKPVVSGELKVSGFSEYLHPIDSEDKYLVAIGKEADDEGTITGFQISLFDASDASNPILLNRLVIENDRNSWSNSEASWDERAFRFLRLGDRMGKLIIPFSRYTWSTFDDEGNRLEKPVEDNFEGFKVFNVDMDSITEDFDIDHSFEVANPPCNHWYESLPERSFVFDGNVMTMKKFTIISTSLTTGDPLWTLPIYEAYIDCEEK